MTDCVEKGVKSGSKRVRFLKYDDEQKNTLVNNNNLENERPLSTNIDVAFQKKRKSNSNNNESLSTKQKSNSSDVPVSDVVPMNATKSHENSYSFGLQIYKQLTNDGCTELDIPYAQVGVDSEDICDRYAHLGTYFGSLKRCLAHSHQIYSSIAHGNIQLIQKFCECMFANGREERLKYEFVVYQHLRRLQGEYIPKVIFFGHTWGRSHLSLIMRDEGISLNNLPLKVKLTKAVKKLAVEALQAVHDAGILHGDVRIEHILLSNDKKAVKLVNFGKSQLCDKAQYFDREMDVLKSELDNFV